MPLCQCVGPVLTQANVCQRCGHSRITIYGNFLPPGAPRALVLTVGEIGALMHPERALVLAVDPSRSTPET